MEIKTKGCKSYLFDNYIYILLGTGLVLLYFLAGLYRNIGMIGLVIIFIILTFNSLKNGGKLDLESKLNLSIIINILFLVFQSLCSLSFSKFYEFTLHIYLVQLLVFFYLLLTRMQIFSFSSIKLVAKVYSLFLYLILAYFLIKDVSLFKHSDFFYYQFPNLLLVGLAFMLISNKNIFSLVAKFLIILIAIYLTNRRTPLLVYFVFLFTYLSWGIISKSRKLFNIYFFLMIIIALIIPFIYLSLAQPDSSLGVVLNKLFIRYTGKRMFSGRDSLWPYAIELIKKNPILGLGLGAKLNSFFGISYSTHNLFFFVIMELGIVGFILFTIILFCLWESYFDNNNPISKVSGSLLITLIIQQTFSLGLIAGKMGFAFSAWTLLILGTYRKENLVLE